MRRFLCIGCGTVKRVRELPPNVEDSIADDPSLRIGLCPRHNPRTRKGRTNAELFDRVKGHHIRRKSSAPAPSKKEKKGKKPRPSASFIPTADRRSNYGSAA